MLAINLIKPETDLERKRRLNLASVRSYQARHPARVRASIDPDKRRASQRRYDRAHPERNGPARHYGLTAIQVHALVALQCGRCKICQEILRGGRSQHIDHNHETGAVRGILCSGCNTALGKFDDSPAMLERAAEYVRKDGAV